MWHADFMPFFYFRDLPTSKRNLPTRVEMEKVATAAPGSFHTTQSGIRFRGIMARKPQGQTVCLGPIPDPVRAFWSRPRAPLFCCFALVAVGCGS